MNTRIRMPLVLKVSLCVMLAMTFTGINAQTPTPVPRIKQHPASIGGRPANFYLDHKAITSDAKLYYEGRLTPSDNPRTFAILDSALTRNAQIRPFYFFILNQVMKTADVALSEYVATVCTRYVSQYPCEFFQRQTDPSYEVNARRWAEFIAFDLYTTEALKKYSAGLKTTACQTQALDTFLSDLHNIVTEINEH
jgi:hypothetical protein